MTGRGVILRSRAGPPSCPIWSHLHHAEPGLLRGWPVGMEWSPVGYPVTS